jgi:hypothetical protein
MKSAPEKTKVTTTDVNIKDAVSNRNGAPRLPHERDEVPDDQVIDRQKIKNPGNKTPSRDVADT